MRVGSGSVLSVNHKEGFGAGVVWGVVCVLALCAGGKRIVSAGDSESSFSGQVVNARGHGVAGAAVNIAPWHSPNIDLRSSAKTSIIAQLEAADNGVFRVPGGALPEGVRHRRRRVRVWATKGQLISRSRVIWLSHPDANNVALKLLRQRALIATVAFTGGGAVRDAEVQIDLVDLDWQSQDRLGAHYRIVGHTDNEGSLSVDGLPAVRFGEPSVTIRRVGSSPVLVQGSECGLAVTDQALHLRVRLPRLRRLTGTVRNHDGAAAHDVLVADWDADAPPPRQRFSATNADGRFVLDGVPETATMLVVRTRRADDCWPHAIASVPLRLEATAGASVDVGVLRLPRRRPVDIRVVDPSGRALRGSVIVHRGELPLGGRAAQLDADGRVTCPDVPLGDGYFLELNTELPAWGPITSRFPMPTSSSAATLRVTGAGVLIVRFKSGIEDTSSSIPLMAPMVVWRSGASTSSSRHGGLTDEVRLWVGADRAGTLEVSTSDGQRGSANVVLRDNEPTVVHVGVRRR